MTGYMKGFKTLKPVAAVKYQAVFFYNMKGSKNNFPIWYIYFIYPYITFIK